MVIPDTQLDYLVRNPLALLKEAYINELTEDDWKKIHAWLDTHRMTDELHTIWLKSQYNNGKWRYRALGQMFARFATIGKGFSTVDQSTKLRIQKLNKSSDPSDTATDGQSQ